MTKYEELFQQSSITGHWLRSSTGTTSCKMSALLYILIHLLIDKISSSQIPILIEKIKNRIDKNYECSNLKKILSNISTNGIVIKDKSFLTGTMFVGLVKKSQDATLSGNVIDHYFVIIQNKDGTFKTISSYGCSLVCIKQYEKSLDLEEFDVFIKALQQKTRSAKQLIRNFMIQHFLHLDYYIEKEVDPDENDGRTRTKPELRDSEVEGYVTSKYHLEYYPIIDILQTIINKL